MIQIKTFSNEESCNRWLKDTDKKILKYYSNGPDYFFIVYEDE